MVVNSGVLFFPGLLRGLLVAGTANVCQQTPFQDRQMAPGLCIDELLNYQVIFDKVSPVLDMVHMLHMCGSRDRI